MNNTLIKQEKLLNIGNSNADYFPPLLVVATFKYSFQIFEALQSKDTLTANKKNDDLACAIIYE